MANILLFGVKVPFTVGGQDVLIRTLAEELRRRGHNIDIIELPYNVLPKESRLSQAALWRLLRVEEFGGGAVDLVIATKFPSYLVRHPRKSLWLVHQYREMYDLYGGRYSDFSDDPRDEELRRLFVRADQQAIGECAYIAGISKNVISRLQRYNGISGEVLYPPLPQGRRYFCAESEPYILSVGRLCAIKRVDLMIKAMPGVPHHVKLKIVGTADEPSVMEYYRNEIDKHHLWERVEFLGKVNDKQLLDLYAQALAVYYAPFNEDYGYVTLEAMASAKPVIAASDSGGVLEFVTDRKEGLVLSPDSPAIAAGVKWLVENPAEAVRLGRNGRKFIEESGMQDNWDRIIEGLLSPLSNGAKVSNG